MNDELTPSERAALRARIVGGAHGIKPVGAHRNAAIAGSIAAVLVVAIAGGVAATSTLSAPPVATTPAPSATVSAEPTPTPSTTPSQSPTLDRVITEPTSRFSFGCADVAPRVAALFGGTVPEVASTIPRLTGNTWLAGPMQYSFAQAGALYCEFGDFEATWATVAMVPDADGAIEDRRSVLGQDCGVVYPCELVDGTYIAIDGAADGLRGTTDADIAMLESAYTDLRDDLLSAPPSPLQWAPPSGTTALTGACAALLPAERVGEILGIADAVVEPAPRGGWSLESWMLTSRWDAPFCLYYGTDGDPSMDPDFGHLVWLPGGEWAFDTAVSGDEVAVTGGRSTDAARLSAGALGTGQVHYADVLVDGNWMRFALPESVSASDRPTVVAKIAEALFERAYG
jgi:hypothetical protein